MAQIIKKWKYYNGISLVTCVLLWYYTNVINYKYALSYGVTRRVFILFKKDTILIIFNIEKRKGD